MRTRYHRSKNATSHVVRSLFQPSKKKCQPTARRRRIRKKMVLRSMTGLKTVVVRREADHHGALAALRKHDGADARVGRAVTPGGLDSFDVEGGRQGVGLGPGRRDRRGAGGAGCR